MACFPAPSGPSFPVSSRWLPLRLVHILELDKLQGRVRGDGASLEPLAKLADALVGVGAAAVPADAAELVAVQAASKGGGGGGGIRGVWQESGRYGAAAHLSEVTALPSSPSHSLVMPSVV
eukprot:scaffold113673_cov69-Phaeocystis_antarctica.AAC.2